ncbi:MAG: hypothetical protein COU65_00505 [Candidatus Pacebacteria bacterium CG10_big_fil_rev_8_21_14_0_10_42_12]|nr:MAG: hypothetical protein COU65_00505 [Candidatus Pacebacteria bacterium CG10_big_fil_rev_8_21_14_0_10_42_12]
MSSIKLIFHLQLPPVSILPSSGKAGAIGALLSVVFFVVFMTLGFVQPEYSHMRNTISSLVLGEYGWIQILNFIVLSASVVFIGFGLGKKISGKKYNSTFLASLFFSACVIFIALVPTDKTDPREIIAFAKLSATARIHHFFVLGMILVTPFMLLDVLRKIRKNKEWLSIIAFTYYVLIFNFVIGLSWYVLVNFEHITNTKGLIQKVLAANVLVWLALVGRKLNQIERNNS